MPGRGEVPPLVKPKVEPVRVLAFQNAVYDHSLTPHPVSWTFAKELQRRRLISRECDIKCALDLHDKLDMTHTIPA